MSKCKYCSSTTSSCSDIEAETCGNILLDYVLNDSSFKLKRVDNEFYLVKSCLVKIGDYIWHHINNSPFFVETVYQSCLFSNSELNPKILASTDKLGELPLLNINEIHSVLTLDNLDSKAYVFARKFLQSNLFATYASSYKAGYRQALKDYNIVIKEEWVVEVAMQKHCSTGRKCDKKGTNCKDATEKPLVKNGYIKILNIKNA